MFFLLFVLVGLLAGLVFAIVAIIKLSADIRKYVLGVVFVLALALIGYGTYRYCSIERDGEVRVGYVRVGDRYYESVNIDFSKEGKIIGKIDDYDIREIPEDPEHNFLVVRTFLDQYYVVDRDYVIPTEGELSCAYVDGRSCDKESLAVLNAIFKEEDGRWVLVYQEDYEYDSEKDMIYATCYKIPDEYWDALQKSGMFD